MYMHSNITVVMMIQPVDCYFVPFGPKKSLKNQIPFESRHLIKKPKFIPKTADTTRYF